MLEKQKLFIDNIGFSGEVLMDLSKAFDTVNHPYVRKIACMLMDSAKRF